MDHILPGANPVYWKDNLFLMFGFVKNKEKQLLKEGTIEGHWVKR